MLRVEIASEEVKTKSGIGRSGRPYQIREQQGYLHRGEKYPFEMRVQIKDDQPPYAVGMYTLSDESFYVGDFGALRVRPLLVPVAADAKRTA